MKTLIEYINENIVDILESKFADKEWVCGSNQVKDYHYAKAVIDKLIQDKMIRLGVNANKGLTKITIGKNIEDLVKLQTKLYSDPESTTSADFNKLNLGFNWNEIFKGDFSGVTVRCSNGQIFESLVAHLYNTEDYNEANIEKWATKFNVTLDNSWVISSKRSAELLREFTTKKYGKTKFIACHVDAQNYNSNIPAKILEVASIFTGTYDGKNITNGVQKDKWNPADIVLVTDDIEYLDSFLEKCKSTGTDKSFNSEVIQAAITEAIGAGKVLGISLKKINETTGKVYGHNVKDAEYIDTYSINDVKLKLAKTYSTNKKNSGTMFVVGICGEGDTDKVNLEIQFRCQTEQNGNLSIEAHLPNNKFARGGKGISIIKKKLGITSNADYYLNIKSDDELLQLFKKYKCKDINDKPISKESIKDAYSKVCFKGFFGLLEKFTKDVLKNTKDVDPLLAFGQYIWSACVDCPSAYYIIK